MNNKVLVLAGALIFGAAGVLAGDADDNTTNANSKKNPVPTPYASVKGKPASQPWPKRPLGEGGHSPRLAPEQEQQVLDFLKANRPEQYAQLTKLRDASPDRYNRAMRVISRWMESMEDMPETVKAAAFARQDAQVEIADLVPQVHAATDPAAKADLTAKLRAAVNRQLDAEQTLREHRLSLLHKQVLQMQEELQKRREQRAQMVEEQVEMYLKSAPPRKTGEHSDRPDRPDRLDRPDRPDKPPLFKRSGTGGGSGGPGGGPGGPGGGPRGGK